MKSLRLSLKFVHRYKTKKICRYVQIFVDKYSHLDISQKSLYRYVQGFKVQGLRFRVLGLGQ
jgi:hypothetical protein